MTESTVEFSKKSLTVVCYALAIITLIGTIGGWSSNISGNSPWIGAGATLLLIHAAANPNLLLTPFKQNTLSTGRLRWAAKLGLLLLILGGIDASGVLDATPRTPRVI